MLSLCCVVHVYFLSIWWLFLPYSQSYQHDLPRMTSLSPTGGGDDKLHDLLRAKSDYDVTGKHAETATSYG